MKIQMRRAILMVAILLFVPVMAIASDIHVATNGSDDNLGTEEAPLLTIHKAMEMVRPGDRVSGGRGN